MLGFLKEKKIKKYIDLQQEHKDKIDILKDSGMSASEIAQELKIPVPIIYRYNELKNRKGKVTIGAQVTEAQAIKQRIEAQRLQQELEIQKKKDEMKLKQLDLELELKQVEIDLKRQELYTDEEEDTSDSTDALAMQFFSRILSPGQNAASTGERAEKAGISDHNASLQEIQGSASDLSHEQITELLQTLPRKQIKRLKNMTPETRHGLIKAYLPNISDASIQRAEEVLTDF